MSAAPTSSAPARRLWPEPRVLGATALLALLAACGRAGSGRVDSGEGDAPLSVVLVTVDCLRADHVEAYGAPAGATPALARLAEQGLVFERAYANAPFTAPSHASLFTGLHTQSHGVLSWGQRLDPDAETFAEAFAAAGFATGAFYNHPSLAATDVLRGFETVDLEVLGPWPDTLANFEAFLDVQASDGAPFAAWVHLWDVHRPYGYRNWSFFQEAAGRADDELEQAYAEGGLEPGERSVGRREEHYNLNPAERAGPLPLGGERPGRAVQRRVLGARDFDVIEERYRAAVRFADDGVGALVAALERRGLLERTLLVVTADHGESLTERPGCYFTHDPFLHEETLRVPLIARWPEGRWPAGTVPGGRDARLVRGVDVAPTLLAAAGLPIPSAVQGRDLFARGTSNLPPPVVFAETRTRHAKETDARLGPDEAGWLEHRAALSDERWRLVRDLNSGAEQLFDLARDPGESQDLSAGGGAEENLARLSEQLDALLSGLPRAGEAAAEIDCEELRRLVLLGYLDPSALEDCE